MKIIGDVKGEYYDYMLAIDRDPTPVYRRVNDVFDATGMCVTQQRAHPWWIAHGTFIQQLWRSDVMLPMRRIRRDVLNNYGVSNVGGDMFNTGVVGFCGRLYPYYSFATKHTDGKMYTSFAYNHYQLIRGLEVYLENEKAELDKFTKDYEIKHCESTIGVLKTRIARLRNADHTTFGLAKTAPSFLTWQRFQTGASIEIGDEPFRHFKSPALHTNGEIWEVNPLLKALDFPKALDATQAWQRLNQYLDNNLADIATPPNPVTDELKRDAHGFDRQSFKNTKNRKKVDRGTWED